MENSWIVKSNQSGMKIIDFLAVHFEHQYSMRGIKKLIEKNSCKINRKIERFASSLVYEGDLIQFISDDSLLKTTAFTFEESRVLFEDSYLLIYDKPAGIDCNPEGIQKCLREKDCHLQLVHRLDKETTGLLILAKKPLVFERLVEQFRTLKVEKTYQAIVDGLIKGSSGVINNTLGKLHQYQGQTLWGSCPPAKGLVAVTAWKKLGVGHQTTWVECYPKTGRTHQLRVHLSEMGHPILGDHQYGKNFVSAYQPKRYLLHSYKIRFSHPITEQGIQLTAPIPSDFEEAKSQLKIKGIG